MAPPSPARQKAARDRLRTLTDYAETAYAIHYACEGFHDGPQHRSPRITSIAVRNLDSGQTFSFSIQQEIELRRLDPRAVRYHLDELERGLLERFFGFLRECRNCRFLHWNMKDTKFGFGALEHRAAVLGIEAYCLPDTGKYDLARLLVEMYGSNYVGGSRLSALAELNGLPLGGCLEGREEAAALHEGRYLDIQRSTICKVALIAELAALAGHQSLKTEAGLWTVHGGKLREALYLVHDHPIRSVIAAMVASFLGALQILTYFTR